MIFCITILFEMSDTFKEIEKCILRGLLYDMKIYIEETACAIEMVSICVFIYLDCW